MNTVHVFRDGTAWAAKIGHPADGMMAWSDVPSRAFLGLATRLCGMWHPFDHTRTDGSWAADEIHANVARVWRVGDPDLAGGMWRAQLGPGSDGRGLEATGANPGSALFALAGVVFQAGWRFHPEWHPG